jgi:hypothetical protein
MIFGIRCFVLCSTVDRAWGREARVSELLPVVHLLQRALLENTNSPS